jgi:hypothetical protein
MNRAVKNVCWLLRKLINEKIKKKVYSFGGHPVLTMEF